MRVKDFVDVSKIQHTLQIAFPTELLCLVNAPNLVIYRGFVQALCQAFRNAGFHLLLHLELVLEGDVLDTSCREFLVVDNHRLLPCRAELIRIVHLIGFRESVRRAVSSVGSLGGCLVV